MQLKKFRLKHELFVVEGAKSVSELLGSDYEIIMLLGSPGFLKEHAAWLRHKEMEVHEANAEILTSAGFLENNHSALAIARMKTDTPFEMIPGKWILALDGIKDPGNLGTIIRTADWFGFDRVLCSEETVELYNPKVLLATMGSFTRVQVHYTNLKENLSSLNGPVVWGAYMSGDNILEIKPGDTKGGVLLLGSEANGIDVALEPLINRKIAIQGQGRTESLNVAVAAGILMHQLSAH